MSDTRWRAIPYAEIDEGSWRIDHSKEIELVAKLKRELGIADDHAQARERA